MIEERLNEEFEDLVKWYIAPEPDEDYPDDRYEDLGEDSAYSVDIILDRDIE
ncbi:hypothetical protein ACT7DL_23535 [Bacillus paranthracis]